MAVPRERYQLICGRANQWTWLNNLKEKRRQAATLQKLLFGGGFGGGVGVLLGETLDAAGGVN
jgi:hypothetical protein